jgi:hypothetical protein
MGTSDYAYIYNALTKEQLLSGNLTRKVNQKTKRGIIFSQKDNIININFYIDEKFIKGIYIGTETDELGNYLYLDEIISDINSWLKCFPDYDDLEKVLPWGTYSPKDWIDAKQLSKVSDTHG